MDKIKNVKFWIFDLDNTLYPSSTNLFSKIASQNGTLKLFAGGRQIKSLVPLIDVARCFKFMEEKNNFLLKIIPKVIPFRLFV